MRRRKMKKFLSALTIAALMGTTPLSAAAADVDADQIAVEATEEAGVLPAEEVTETTEAAPVEEATEITEETTVEEYTETTEETTVEEATETTDEATEEVIETEEGDVDIQNEESPVYVLMNIPYSEFYEAEGTSDVDAMTSATKSKPRTGSLAGGSYHVNSDGSDVTGVIYPVKVENPSLLDGLKQVTDADSVEITVTNRGQQATTTYAGKDALFENPSYAYYVLSETPKYYKTLTENADGSFSFDAATGTITERTVSADLITGSDTTYGDYQINVDYEPETVYGIVLHTKEGGNYGLKHVENIWLKNKLSISTGHTTETHGCPLQVYEGAEGQTVDSITYYTSSGIEKLSLTEALYLAPVLDDITAQAENAKTVKLSGLPEDVKDAKATVTYTEGSGRGAKTTIVAEDVAITDGQIALENELEDGKNYKVKVASSNYATSDASFTYEKYIYTYAGLTWNEFWASEGVYAAGNTESSTTVDAKGETDKGGFDAVTRATANHGLHRGSFQSMATIYDTEGNTYEVSHWSADGKTIYLTDGTTVGWARGTIKKADGSTATMSSYRVTGIKYVPVAVSKDDYEDFASKYNVVEANGTLAGGYGEMNLVSYVKTANVTAKTNGLKVAEKNADGTYTFAARQNGTESGLADEALKKAENITYEVKEANGAYGEFLRVDLNGDGYGALGSAMYAVKWSYYGNQSEETADRQPLATYGTKFAADNWMHKAMGIQLGLTESVRCQLPEGTDRTGYWALTVYAMGYEDYTVNFSVSDNNIVKPEVEEVNVDTLKAAITEAEALSESNYTETSWAAMQLELAEAKEAVETATTQAIVDEATEHLNNAVKALVAVDKLNAEIKSAEKLNKSNYTDASWKTMQAALTKAKETVKTAATQDDVDEAVEQLKGAVKALVTKTTPKVTLKAKTVTYNGKAQGIAAATVTGSKGKVTYTYYSDSACKKKVSAANVKNAGVYYVKASVAQTATSKAATSSAVKLTIKKANAAIKTKTTSKTYKVADVKKKAQSYSIGASATSKGKVTYKVTKKNNNVSVSNAGKVTVKKGTKKGTYNVTVKISAAANTNYNAVSKTVTIKVVVK